ncbi:MAG: hypothetical protein NTY19_23730 [Planctomycetota bacterium]|nr:hypothetical protein [Planctomycetota bacterium]
MIRGIRQPRKCGPNGSPGRLWQDKRQLFSGIPGDGDYTLALLRNAHPPSIAPDFLGTIASRTQNVEHSIPITPMVSGYHPCHILDDDSFWPKRDGNLRRANQETVSGIREVAFPNDGEALTWWSGNN